MKTLRYFTAVFAIVALASCNKDEMELGDFASDPDAVRINATVGDHLTRSNPIGATEAERKTFNIGDKIRVGADGQNHIVYTYDGTNWIPEDGKYLKWNNNIHAFSAYYPETTQDGVKSDQSTIGGLQASDLMWDIRHEQAKTPDRTITLNFQRRTARIVISKTIEWGTQYEGYSVTGLQIHSLQWGEDLTVAPYCEHSENYYALVNPNYALLADKTFLTVKIQKSGEANAPEIIHTITGIPVLEEGKSYQFALRIGRDKAEIGSVTVEGWQSGKIVDDDVQTTEAPDYKTSVAGGITTYHIYTAKGLQDVNAIMTASDVTAATLASNISLECDITLPAVAEGESNWTPIGVSRDLTYTGTFGGNGYTLTGLTINSTEQYQGLIAYLGAAGVVRHLTLADCTVKGSKYVGAVVARASDGSIIRDCHVKATVGNTVTVEAKDDGRAGGIVGVGYGKISGCSLTTDRGAVNVIAKMSCSGGIVGDGSYENSELSGFHLSECLVSASGNGTITIQGTDCIGGIIGTVHGVDPTVVGVLNCHITNNGGTITVTGRDQVGGVVGRNWSNTAHNCHADGVQVTGSSIVGGLVGSNGYVFDKGYIIGSNSVKNCAVIGTTADDADYVHWDIGWNINEVQDPAIIDGGGNSVTILTE